MVLEQPEKGDLLYGEEVNERFEGQLRIFGNILSCHLSICSTLHCDAPFGGSTKLWDD